MMTEHNCKLLRVICFEDNVTHTKIYMFCERNRREGTMWHCLVLCKGTADVHRLFSRHHHQSHAGRSYFVLAKRIHPSFWLISFCTYVFRFKFTGQPQDSIFRHYFHVFSPFVLIFLYHSICVSIFSWSVSRCRVLSLLSVGLYEE